MSRYRRPLDDDTMLNISISAAITRHQFDADATAALAEIRELAGDRTDILAEVAGRWAGFYGDDLGVQPALVDALRALPGAEQWVELGIERRSAGKHSAPNPSEKR